MEHQNAVNVLRMPTNISNSSYTCWQNGGRDFGEAREGTMEESPCATAGICGMETE